MADVDGRGHGGDRYRGGGGGKKRRYREDDDYGRQPQRRRFDEPLSVKVRKQILSIGEQSMRPEDDVSKAARSITDNYDDEIFRNSIVQLLPQIVMEQPFRIPFTASIVLHVNQAHPEMAGRVLQSFGSHLQEQIEAGEWRLTKLLLRFFGLVQGILEADGIFSILEELFSRAVDLQTASQEDTLGLELVKVIMLTVPYILAYDLEGSREKASEILQKTAVVASAPHAVEGAVNPYLDPGIDGTPQCPGVLGLLQSQLQNEAEKDWELKFISRAYPQKHTASDSADGANGESTKKHALPSITVPETVKMGAKAMFPEVFFSLYADQDIESVPRTSSLATCIIRDVLVDNINLLDFNRGAVAKFLIDMEFYFPSDTFAPRATQLDKLRDAPEGAPTWKAEDMLVDAVFSQMLQLPAPEHKLVYYHSMITETCKLAPGAIAPSLGRGIRSVYRSIVKLDLELSYRFMDWFAHHLSNFDFRWKWIEWVEDVELPLLHPRKSFIHGVLDKEVRLSFARRIRETLPEAYQPLIPAKKDNDIPEFKFNDPTHQFSEQGKQVLGLIRRKAPDEEITAVLESIQGTVAENDPSVQDPTPVAVDAFITALCHIGSKSLSHVLSYIERHRVRLLGQTSQASRQATVAAVVDYWRYVHPGVAVAIVDKLLNYNAVGPADVLGWALAPERVLTLLPEDWVYELVAGTLTKVARRVQQVAVARNVTGLPATQCAVLEETLSRERTAFGQLLSLVEDALAPVAEGSHDMMLEEGLGETVGGQAGSGFSHVVGGKTEVRGEERAELLRLWGAKWVRCFRRARGVQATVIDTIVAGFPPPGEDVDIPDAADGKAQNGQSEDADGDRDHDVADV